MINNTAGDSFSEGKLMEVINRIGNSLLIGFLFLICSIPIVTIGASISAFYYSMMKSVRCQRSYPVKEFFRAFKKNLLKGSLYTVLIIAVTALLLFGRNISLNEISKRGLIAGAVYDVLLVFDIAFAVWIFPVISRFDISFGRTVRLTITLAIKYFYYTIILFAGLALFVLLILKLSVGFILVVPAVACYAATYVVEPALRGFMEKPEDDADAWYFYGK